jgi:hypothetical protein
MRVCSLTLATIAVGYATAASGATLTIVSLNTSNVAQTTFNVGDTILLRVDGDPQGQSSLELYGALTYNGAITTTIGVTPGSFLPGAVKQPLVLGVGEDCLPFGCTVYSEVFHENSPSTTVGVSSSSTLMLIADAIGDSSVAFGGEDLNFFDIQQYPPDPNHNPAGVTTASFKIVPEPGTATLIGLGLLGLAGWRRACAD